MSETAQIVRTWTAADVHAAPELHGALSTLMAVHGIDTAEVMAVSLCLDGLDMKLRVHRADLLNGRKQPDPARPGEVLMQPDTDLPAGSILDIVTEARLPDDSMMAQLLEQMDED
ncbi:hypothetical protein [Actinocorallia longicatena]|uniref:Uncharacterized protein n=1 Tax=Actinocorallia longicatena TaxID=111803 RepID=A0ABP6QF67_9ACTN